jgi:hypothetical protein
MARNPRFVYSRSLCTLQVDCDGVNSSQGRESQCDEQIRYSAGRAITRARHGEFSRRKGAEGCSNYTQ